MAIPVAIRLSNDGDGKVERTYIDEFTCNSHTGRSVLIGIYLPKQIGHRCLGVFFLVFNSCNL